MVISRFDVLVLLGNGDGTFQAEQRIAMRDTAKSVAVADLNGDGRPDLVTAGHIRLSNDQVGVLLGNGDGTFQREQSIDVGDHPDSVAVADLNGDGQPDLVTANFSSDDVSVLLNR